MTRLLVELRWMYRTHMGLFKFASLSVVSLLCSIACHADPGSYYSLKKNPVLEFGKHDELGLTNGSHAEMVPLSVARYFATVTARRFHQIDTIYDELIYFNLEGNPSAYTFVFSRSTSDDDDSALLNLDRYALEIEEQKSEIEDLIAQGKAIEQSQIKLLQLEQLQRSTGKYVSIVTSTLLAAEPLLDQYRGLPHSIYKEASFRLQQEVEGDSESGALIGIYDGGEYYFASVPRVSLTSPVGLREAIRELSFVSTLLGVEKLSSAFKSNSASINESMHLEGLSANPGDDTLSGWELYTTLYNQTQVKE